MAKDESTATGDNKILEEAKEAFKLASDYESDNRNLAEDDLRFSRLGDQWDQDILRQRDEEGRPALTINKLPAFIRQVVNETRQNKPSIKVRPVDSGADVETAKIISGLIKNIEYTSDADVAYDTASDFAVSMGFGYYRIDVDYAHDDTFDQDIRIERIPNPFNVFGDPYSTAFDSSDWNTAFVVDYISHKQFERKYKGAEKVDWDGEGYTQLDEAWFSAERVMVAEYWTRKEIARPIVRLSDGRVMDRVLYEEEFDAYDAMGLTVEDERSVPSHEVTHRLLTGAEVLETTDWPGRFIPIIPVYGEEVNVEGKRYFRSLIRDAKDAQRMFNYWRTSSTELVALAPKAPYIGPESAFSGKDARKWSTANTQSYAYLSYPNELQGVPPQRQPFAGVPAGALQESLNANDDMKAIIGIYDPSLGARSNETSGRAIIARQRESDTSTFHFPDNLNRSIRHGGRVVLDLIPHVYSGERIIRIVGEDDKTNEAAIGGEESETPEGFSQIYNLTVGKYDLVMDEGPSYQTQRQEAAEQMFELLRVFPQAASVIGDLLVSNLDWPGADEIAERLKALVPGMQQEDPRLGQAMQTIEMLKGQLQEAMDDRQMEVAKLRIEAQKAASKAETDRINAEIKALENQEAAKRDEFKNVIAAYDAETKRAQVVANATKDVVNPPGPYD